MPELSDEDLEELVAACNSAIWWLQLGTGSPPEAPTPRLEDAPGWMAESTRDSVLAVLAGVTAEQLWRRWAAAKRKDGWKRGDVKDPVKKTHPCLVDNYSHLPEHELFKDRVFLGIVQDYTRRRAAGKDRETGDRP
jgi:hypothetical protein